jgi:purine-binding chemotaxis protein CheW
MTTTVAAHPAALRVCLLVLGGEVFAVDVRCAREVVALDELTVVPQAPSHVAGVANVRGHVLPVLDVRPLLGLPPQGVGPGTRAIVLEAAPLQAAVLTEGVLGLAAFDEVIPVGDARPQQRSAFAIGVLRRDEGPAMLLDVPGILNALRIRAPGPGAGGAPTPTPPTTKV